MAYVDFIGGVQGPLGSAQSLASTAVVAQFLFDRQSDVDQVQFALTTTVSSSVSVVVAFKKRPIPGSSSGESTIASLIIPTGTAAGKVVYKRFDEVSFGIGEALSVEVTTASSSAGAGYAGFQAESDPETPANNADMIASA